MNYLRNVVSDVKLRYRAGRVVADCVLKREQPHFPQFLTECVAIADESPELILSSIRLYLVFTQPESAYGGLLLLEQLVSLCNYAFHLSLARDYDTQDRIVHLAMKRGEGEAHRKAQRLARLTLLEYSRVFVDDRDLLRLSALASSFEHRTHKSLMRCLNVQNRRVRFRDVASTDIIDISPKECIGFTSSSTSRPVKPLQLSSAPEVWPCHVCTYLNAPSAMRCAACETLRSVDPTVHLSSSHATADAPAHLSGAAASASHSNEEKHTRALPAAGCETGGARVSSHVGVEDVDETSPINDVDDDPGAQLYPCRRSATNFYADPVPPPGTRPSPAAAATYMFDVPLRLSSSLLDEEALDETGDARHDDAAGGPATDRGQAGAGGDDGAGGSASSRAAATAVPPLVASPTVL
ncbi:Zn-finger in Ran binding protein [Novymonas esmeraldas]|uniref:Zn-finger in Ran binding protein n=1 Tax=Novymonas esmeraldas TaxID=1808958 RepID=A0AAW0F599_9TRYP